MKHAVVSEPEGEVLADALHDLKLSFAKRLRRRGRVERRSFWQKRW